jgi:hypothetical protein
MFERLKRALEESFVGAIALGYLLAQIILNFVDIFASPVAHWVSEKDANRFLTATTAPASFALEDALPDLIRFFLLLLVWYVLLRWLYIKPLKKDASEPGPNREQADRPSI